MGGFLISPISLGLYFSMISLVALLLSALRASQNSDSSSVSISPVGSGEYPVGFLLADKKCDALFGDPDDLERVLAFQQLFIDFGYAVHKNGGFCGNGIFFAVCFHNGVCWFVVKLCHKFTSYAFSSVPEVPVSELAPELGVPAFSLGVLSFASGVNSEKYARQVFLQSSYVPSLRLYYVAVQIVVLSLCSSIIRYA